MYLSDENKIKERELMLVLCLVNRRHLYIHGSPESIPTQGLLFHGAGGPVKPSMWPMTLAFHAMGTGEQRFQTWTEQTKLSVVFARENSNFFPTFPMRTGKVIFHILFPQGPP